MSNGAANILRKIAATLGLSLKGVSSGALTKPARVQKWTACESPSMQERGESRLPDLPLPNHPSVCQFQNPACD